MTDRQPIAMVVDDEPLVRITAADMITDAGFDLLEAPDAEEAIFYLKQYPSLRLLFTDISMPEIDGLTLAKHVKDKWPHVSVIVTSVAVVPTDKHLPKDVRFIAKPISPQLLVDTIREVCGLSQSLMVSSSKAWLLRCFADG